MIMYPIKVHWRPLLLISAIMEGYHRSLPANMVPRAAINYNWRLRRLSIWRCRISQIGVSQNLWGHPEESNIIAHRP